MKKCPRCGELLGDNVDRCFECSFDFNNPHDASELRRSKTEELKRKCADIIALNDCYEYDVVTLCDNNTGMLDISELKSTLSAHANNGWRLVSLTTNEIGRNSSRIGSYGTNATIDQTILIFERCIRRYNMS